MWCTFFALLGAVAVAQLCINGWHPGAALFLFQSVISLQKEIRQMLSVLLPVGDLLEQTSSVIKL